MLQILFILWMFSLFGGFFGVYHTLSCWHIDSLSHLSVRHHWIVFVLRYICTFGVCAPLSFYFRMMATTITVQKLTLMAQRPMVGGSGNNVERTYTVHSMMMARVEQRQGEKSGEGKRLYLQLVVLLVCCSWKICAKLFKHQLNYGEVYDDATLNYLFCSFPLMLMLSMPNRKCNVYRMLSP